MLRHKKRIRRNTYKGRHQHRRQAFWSAMRTSVRLILITAAFAVFNLALILGHDWMTQTDRLGIRSITVDGCQRLSPEAVKAQAGLDTAHNILAVNLTTTRKRLLAHPWIAQARVTRDIPDRLQIYIREHTCLAVLDLGRRFLLSDTGQVFKELESSEMPAVPVVRGLTYTDLGLETDAPAPILQSVMALLAPRRKDGRSPLADRIREVHADPALGLTVFWNDDRLPQGYRTIVLGFGDFDAKLTALQRIDAYLRRHPPYAGFESIDVKNLNRIIVHPVTTGATANARKEV